MDRSDKNVWCLLILLSIFFCFLPIADGNANSIVGIEPAASTVQVGDIFNLGINISNVSDLYSFQFDIGFNPIILSALGIGEGPFLPSGGSTVFFPGVIDHITGKIGFTADSLIGTVPGVSGSGTVVNLLFQAVALGVSTFDLSSIILLDSNFAEISFDTAGGSVEVRSAAIPEPVSIILLGTGLISVLIFRTRCFGFAHNLRS